jgi:hypothetical protein
MSEVDLSDLAFVHRVFADTEYGQRLSHQIRWERYKPEQVSNEQWQKLLGVDVNNLGHLALTGCMSRSFIRLMNDALPGYFSGEDGSVVVVAGYTHDWPEVIATDKTYSDRTPKDAENEKQVFKQYLKEFYPGCPTEMEQIINRAVNEVIYSPSSQGLARDFNAIERVGYMRTALRAASHISAGTAAGCQDGFKWLVADAFSNQVTKLISYSRFYPPVESYMKNQSQAISAAFEVVDRAVFLNFRPEQRAQKQLAFNIARMAWGYWSTNS